MRQSRTGQRVDPLDLSLKRRICLTDTLVPRCLQRYKLLRWTPRDPLDMVPGIQSIVRGARHLMPLKCCGLGFVESVDDSAVAA